MVFMWHLSPGFGQCLGIFFLKRPWLFSGHTEVDRKKKKNISIHIYIHILYLHTLRSKEKTSDSSFDDFLFVICLAQPGSSFF